MLTKCAFYCLTGFGLYSAILEKSGVAVFLYVEKMVEHWRVVEELRMQEQME